ncbi:hypothetical protein AUC61_07785 [Pseudomonas sp. S25]|uniref:Uncharacterized protein n=1 Tax=Pseudomonas maioricensis TaxID=1766623 RepID=A0ABS9ZIP1_9PSED|nr:hypothetical protein [Pseudomonas sp. S25]MCI8209432.1 hypothetical protein [Pseudomonas sp. S25]
MSVLLTQGDEHAWEQSMHVPLTDVVLGFQQLVARQVATTKARLCDQQAALLGPQGKLSIFSRQVATQGRQAPGLVNLPEFDDVERQQEVEKAVDFALGFHQRRTLSANPFHDLSRSLLCCMVFDDLADYTLAERFAAYEALRQRDSQYFIKLIATTRHTVERRLVFTGLLEHFDALLPIEQSIYPAHYRRAQQKHLEREEAVYGRLELKRTVSELLEEHTPEWILTHLCTSTSAID